MNRLVLGEYETLDEAELPLDEAELPLDKAVALAATGAVEVLRTASPGRWTLRAGNHVGAVRVGETEVQIRPKVPVARLLYLLGYGGVVRSQFRSWLDEDGRIPVRPDLTWWSQGHCIAVVDAKYKALRLAEAPNADLYQMLAYCKVMELPRGYLVYAAGDELPRTHVIRNSGVEVYVHTIDLAGPVPALRTQVERLAEQIAIRPAG